MSLRKNSGSGLATAVSCFDLKNDRRIPFCENYFTILPDTPTELVWEQAGLLADTHSALFLSWVPRDGDSTPFERVVKSFAGSHIILVGDPDACGGVGFSGSMKAAGFSEVVFEENLPNFLGWSEWIRVLRRKSRADNL